MFLYAHSGVRYLVLLLGVLTVAYALYGVVGKREYDATMRRLSMAFAGTVHLQVLLGFGVLFTRTFYPQLIGHIFMMLFGAVVAQLPPSIMRRREAARRTYLPHVVGTLIAFALILFGILAIDRPILGSALG